MPNPSFHRSARKAAQAGEFKRWTATMMTKEAILSEIQRAAAELGGRVGLAALMESTGIPQKQILGKYWATWNEALAEAGIETASFGKPGITEETVLEAVGQLVVRLGKRPTENELSLQRRLDSSFPSLSVIRRLRKDGNVKSKLLVHCTGRSDLAPAREVVAHLPDSGSDNSTSIGRAPIQGFVYMMRSGKRYKIGHTNSPARRHREVRLDLPDSAHVVHSIETDDSPGIEKYWRRRFASKQVRDTEFFQLNASDVAAFKRRKYQ